MSRTNELLDDIIYALEDAAAALDAHVRFHEEAHHRRRAHQERLREQRAALLSGGAEALQEDEASLPGSAEFGDPLFAWTRRWEISLRSAGGLVDKLAEQPGQSGAAAALRRLLAAAAAPLEVREEPGEERDAVQERLQHETAYARSKAASVPPDLTEDQAEAEIREGMARAFEMLDWLHGVMERQQRGVEALLHQRRQATQEALQLARKLRAEPA